MYIVGQENYLLQVMKPTRHPSRLGPLRRRVQVAKELFGQSMPKRDLQDSSEYGPIGTSVPMVRPQRAVPSRRSPQKGLI